jgi:hypothetical protein
MENENDTPVVATVPESDAKTVEPSTDQAPDNRPKLTKEEQYNVLQGRLKRLAKDLGKDDAPQTSNPDSSDLLQKAFLRTAGISDQEEVDLALSTAKKWGVGVDALVDDDDFKAKLDKHRTTKANELATSDIKGSGAAAQANQQPSYYIARGTPPSASEVPDRKARAAIARAMMQNASTSGKRFYND